MAANETANYNKSVCIEGCVFLWVDFLLYSICLVYILRRDGKSRYGLSTLLMLILPLIDYFLAALGRVSEAAKGHNNHNDCNAYFTLDWIRQIMAIASVCTGVVCNIFMLRNVSIAVILNSDGDLD